MFIIEDVPMKIIETGEEVVGRIETDISSEPQTSYIVLQYSKPCGIIEPHIKIGEKEIQVSYFRIECNPYMATEEPLKIRYMCKTNISYREWQSTANDAFHGKAIESLLEERTDIYSQKPLEKDFLTDNQRNRIEKLFEKEFDEYFNSEKSRISYKDAMEIEKIVRKVLKGE